MKEEILTAKIEQIDLTPKIVKLLMGEFKDRPEVFKMKVEGCECVDNGGVIKEDSYEDFLKANNIKRSDNESDKPGLGHWLQD
tara:strand:- start:3106 stop:3354 length:249 start_codon:yes stop_codon:yes gene_type:complete